MNYIYIYIYILALFMFLMFYSYSTHFSSFIYNLLLVISHIFHIQLHHTMCMHFIFYFVLLLLFSLS